MVTSSENRVIFGPMASCHGLGADKRIFSWFPTGYEGGNGKEYVVAVSCWRGDSRAVARENWLQVTDADIQRAVQGKGGSGSSGSAGAAQNRHSKRRQGAAAASTQE